MNSANDVGKWLRLRLNILVPRPRILHRLVNAPEEALAASVEACQEWTFAGIRVVRRPNGCAERRVSFHDEYRRLTDEHVLKAPLYAPRIAMEGVLAALAIGTVINFLSRSMTVTVTLVTCGGF